MESSTLFLSASQYLIINKDLMRKFGLESTVVLCALIHTEEACSISNKKPYFLTKIAHLTSETTLSAFKIKSALNKLYKAKLIDVVVKNDEKISIKIIHTNILSYLATPKNNTHSDKYSNKKSKIKNTRFKKPTIKELKKYFLKLGINTDESEIMFDYYESKGWKVGTAPMKCWKSATRNWVRRINKKTDFPDHYDKKFETQICDDPETLSKYHSHLKKLGWESIYSPSAGTKWRKIKI